MAPEAAHVVGTAVGLAAAPTAASAAGSKESGTAQQRTDGLCWALQGRRQIWSAMRPSLAGAAAERAMAGRRYPEPEVEEEELTHSVSAFSGSPMQRLKGTLHSFASHW